jgi:hypothetical protein
LLRKKVFDFLAEAGKVEWVEVTEEDMKVDEIRDEGRDEGLGVQ